MPVMTFSSSSSTMVVFYSLSIDLSQFSTLVQNHLANVEDTLELEAVGERLRKRFLGKNDLTDFIKRVCQWGNYPGIAGRILKQNDFAKIRVCFERALEALSSDPANVHRALHEINQIRQLGSPSFASKHLRFLRPDVCPVLDRVIATRLGYDLNADGYRKFSEDCLQIAQILQQRNVSNPISRQDGQWFAADVEMAVFAYLNDWQT